MKTEVKEIPFYNDNMLGIKTEDGRIWLAVTKTCLDIGLTEDQAKKQSRNIQEDILYNTSSCIGWKKLSAKLDTQVREIVVLHEKFVPIWLAKISITPTMQRENPDAVSKLLKYQLEATDVLHNAFMGTEEKKQEFYNFLGLEGEIISLQKKIETLEETLDTQNELFSMVMDNMTLSTRQQEKILEHARKRVNYLLGGAHSEDYKRNGRTYLVNLWNNLKENFHCGASYKDLNPLHYDLAIDFIDSWTYNE